MGYQTQSAYGRVSVVNLKVEFIRVTDHERGIDHITATCYESFVAIVSPSNYVEAQYVLGEHEGEGFYALDIEVPVNGMISAFRI